MRWHYTKDGERPCIIMFTCKKKSVIDGLRKFIYSLSERRFNSVLKHECAPYRYLELYYSDNMTGE